MKKLINYFFIVSIIFLLTGCLSLLATSYEKTARLIFSFAFKHAGYDLHIDLLDIKRSLAGNEYYLDKVKVNEVEGETHFYSNKIIAKFSFLDLVRLDDFLKVKLEDNSLRVSKLKFDTKSNFFIDYLLDKTSLEVVDLELTGSLGQVEISDYFYFFYGTSKEQKNTLITVKDLEIDKANLGPLSFPNISFSLNNSLEGIKINLKSNDLLGSITINSPLRKGLEFNLSRLKIAENKLGSTNDLFLYLLENLRIPLYFYINDFSLGSKSFGNWNFVIRNDENEIIFDNIKGESELLKLEIANLGKSFLSISKKEDKILSALKLNLKTKNLSQTLQSFNESEKEANFKAGQTNFNANLLWEGFPEDIETSIPTGEISFNFKDVLIRKIDSENSVSDLMKIISLFNVSNTLGDITNLQFREKFKAGFSADSVKGSIVLEQERVLIQNPIVFKSGSGQYSWTGNLRRAPDGNIEDLYCELVMTLPLREYLPAYALLVGGPLTAGMVYIAGKAFKKPLSKLSSGKWKILGTLSNPETEFIEWFE